MGLPSINRKSLLKLEKKIRILMSNYLESQFDSLVSEVDKQIVKSELSLIQIEQLIAFLKSNQADPSTIKKLEDLLYKIASETSLMTLSVLSQQMSVGKDVFNLVNTYARDFAANQSGLLISDINQTTIEIVREKLGFAIDNAFSAQDLADSLVESGAFSEQRALMIARTESSLAHNEGMISSYRESGIAEKEWLIASDACDICLEYDGEIVGIDEAFSSGDYSPPAHPNCRCTTLAIIPDDMALADTPDLTKAETYKPTQAMADEAKLGLKWRELGYKGGTIIGLTRANQLAKRENLSLDTVKRMHSYFSRHEVDKQAEGFNRGDENYPSKGRVAWALWGGDAGQSWARNITEQLKDD